MKRKKTYGFSVVLTAPALSAKECDALYEAGCDDGTIVTRNRVTFIAFDRKADSLEQAIRSATADVRAAGLEVERVEMPKYLKVDPLGSFQLKGKQQEIELYSVYLSLKKSEEAARKRRRSLFRKKMQNV